jgi:hypothetical protein
MLGDKEFQDFAFVINGPSKVVRFAIDLHDDLVQMPSPIRVRTRMIGPIFPNLSSE